MTKIPDNREVFTPEEVAEIMRVSVRTVRNWANSGFLTAMKGKRLLRIHRDELERIAGRSRRQMT